jgi:gluconate 2-dehydrogenase subunit 3-like protein
MRSEGGGSRFEVRGELPDEDVPFTQDAFVTRRALVKALALLPVAGAFGLAPTSSLVSQTSNLKPQTFAPQFFTAHEYQTVRVLADYIIPRDERSGSATDAKVPEFMDYLLADSDASPGSKTAMRGGLAWLDNECRSRFGKTFLQATDAQRRQVLDDIAWPKRARPAMSHGAAFFSRFRDLTASGFFSSAMGWKDVQYQGNVALPEWNGCPPEALKKLGVSY